MKAGCFFALVLLTATPGRTMAACDASSSTTHPHLVELYTTTGCSSCPPAETWMSSLVGKANLVGLEFHVDYWDTDGWRDRFDSHAYSLRQIALANRTKSKQYYTPQIGLDGRPWQDWPKGAPPAPYAGESPLLKLAVVHNGTVLQARIEAPNVPEAAGGSSALHGYIALTENGLSESVKGGENTGKKLALDQVVRAFVGPLSLPLARAALELPSGIDLARSNVVTFLQNDRTGDVIQVVQLHLAQCTLVQEAMRHGEAHRQIRAL
jgi:hypothetical protein